MKDGEMRVLARYGRRKNDPKKDPGTTSPPVVTYESRPPEVAFDAVIENRIAKTRALLLVKGNEYASSDSRFHNFVQGAALMRCTPERALLGYMSKHLVSIVDMIEALDQGVAGDRNAWDEKIGDAIAYLHLLEAMVKKRIEAQTG